MLQDTAYPAWQTTVARQSYLMPAGQAAAKSTCAGWPGPHHHDAPSPRLRIAGVLILQSYLADERIMVREKTLSSN